MSTGFLLFLQVILTILAANFYPLLTISGWFFIIVLALTVVANALPIMYMKHMPTFWLRICAHGHHCLKAFLISLPFSILIQLIFLIGLYSSTHWQYMMLGICLCVGVEAILFWNGMISVYASSVQLGIRHRAVGILLGLVPIANLVMLIKILKITGDEIRYEQEKHIWEEGRKDQFLCKTRYPILLVHGVFL